CGAAVPGFRGYQAPGTWETVNVAKPRYLRGSAAQLCALFAPGHQERLEGLRHAWAGGRVLVLEVAVDVGPGVERLADAVRPECELALRVGGPAQAQVAERRPGELGRVGRLLVGVGHAAGDPVLGERIPGGAPGRMPELHRGPDVRRDQRQELLEQRP